MFPEFLLPETTVREAGAGPEISLGNQQGESLILTLGITRIVEQQSIESQFGAPPTASDWGAKPVASFPQKFYCGTYQIVVDFTDRPHVRYLRAQWQVNRWGKGDSKPLFGIYVFMQAKERQVAALSA